MNFSICTYNCCSLNKNINIIKELTSKEIDVIFLQETFLTVDKLGIIDFIDENYHSFGIPAYFSNENITNVTGRPKGGLVCLWKNNSYFNINILASTNDFIVLDMFFSDVHITIVNVYLRSDLGVVVTQELYLQTLNDLENVLLDFNFNNILYCSDFNTDPFIGL